MANTNHLLFMAQLQAEGLHIQAGPNYQYWPESGWIPYAVLKNTLHLSNLSDCSAPQLMTAEQVKGMTVADHQDDWRLLVFRLAILIPETQGRLDTAAGSRLKVGTHASTPLMSGTTKIYELSFRHQLNLCLTGNWIHLLVLCLDHCGCRP